MCILSPLLPFPQSRFLILEHNLFDVLISTLMDLFRDALVDGKLALTHNNHSHTRIAFCVSDLRYSTLHSKVTGSWRLVYCPAPL